MWEINRDVLVNHLAKKYLFPNDSNNNKRWIFRGIRNYKEHRLESKLERELKTRNDLPAINLIKAEEYLLAQFKRAANQFLEASMVPGDIDKLSWLSLMQHYGAPTRLLDFTRSPYIACFFAVEENNNEDSAIWAINESWLIKNSLNRINDSIIKTKEDLNYAYIAKKKNFKNIFYDDSIPIILPVIPLKSNQRLLVQQGLFLCSGAAKKESFEKNLLSYKSGNGDDMQKNIHKIIINNDLRSEILFELNYMNISRASLFPGLDGFATSLKHEINYKPSYEIEHLYNNHRG